MSKPSMHVLKFGGTSMGSLEAMRKSAGIVCNSPNARLVVVSAMSGTTNQLLKAYEQSSSGHPDAALDTVGAICHRHQELAQAMNARPAVREALNNLAQELTALAAAVNKKDDALLDEVLSFGERLSSVLFAEAMEQCGKKSKVVDARQCLRTDSYFGKAEPDIAATAELSQKVFLPLFDQDYTVVTQGFIGATADGRTTTLGRGGSDYSAALFSEALAADACEIWTDVSGILTMDPRIVPEARRLSDITFAEAAEMANFGAKVLHPATIIPAQRKNIKVFVGNTFAPQEGGTWIHPELPEKPNYRAVALRNKQTLITVSSVRMLNAQGFLARLFTILANNNVTVDLVTTSEATVTLTIDNASSGSSGKSVLENKSLMEELRTIGDIMVEDNLSLVALIGNRLTHCAGVANRVFTALADCNVRLICHGASAGNLCLLVAGDEAAKSALRLHGEFL